VRISLWGGREPKPGERWNFFGYGAVPHSAQLSDAEYRAVQRRASWVVLACFVVIGAPAVAVSVATHSDVAFFVVAVLIPIGLLIVFTLVAASIEYVRYSQRKKRAAAAPPTTAQASSVSQS
jgi:hypothetical protein